MGEFLRLVRRQVVGDLRGVPRRVVDRVDGSARLRRCGNIMELRQLCRRTVPKAVFDFVDGAAQDEVTSRNNQRDFAGLALLPRVLTDVSSVDLGTSVLGERVAVPLLAAPTGLTGLVNHRGELGIARAAHGAGTIYVLSAMASYSIEEVVAQAPGSTWFQLYMWRDRGLVAELLARAADAGRRTLVLTVDVPVAGARERDRRNGFGIPPRLTLRSVGEGLRRPRWSMRFVTRPRMSVANAVGHGGGASDPVSLSDYITSQFDPTVTWTDLAWLREHWEGPIVVKGVLRPEDAERAVGAGASAVVVSNHGGRQLDHASSAVTALPAVVEALGESAEVYLDGGVRRGSDIVKALALGARAVFVGRPLVYGLGAGGDAGAERAITLLTEELTRAMALLGCPRVTDLDASYLRTG